jgi:hypothetical protein
VNTPPHLTIVLARVTQRGLTIKEAQDPSSPSSLLSWNSERDFKRPVYRSFLGEISHIDSHISFDKNWFSRFKSEIISV